MFRSLVHCRPLDLAKAWRIRRLEERSRTGWLSKLGRLGGACVHSDRTIILMLPRMGEGIGFSLSNDKFLDGFI